MPRYALVLAYDGTNFSGWWRQAEERSVGAVLDAAFARLGEATANAAGASRTDAGVHARGQVAHVDCTRPWKADELARALTRQLPPDVVCRGVAAVAPDWHAVHDAHSKTYRYRLDMGSALDPFLAPRISWRLPFTVALQDLQQAAQPVRGERDLSAFLRRGDHRDDLRTQIAQIRWYHHDRYFVCSVRGSRFGYRLVRSLVGGMVATASGTVTPAQWAAALGGTVNPAAQQQAPACGLCLEHVHYPDPPRWGQ